MLVTLIEKTLVSDAPEKFWFMRCKCGKSNISKSIRLSTQYVILNIYVAEFIHSMF